MLNGSQDAMFELRWSLANRRFERAAQLLEQAVDGGDHAKREMHLHDHKPPAEGAKRRLADVSIGLGGS